MCLGIVGKVLSIVQEEAMVDIYGVKTKINVILIDALQIGDYVLIHTGFAIEKISVEKALQIEEMLHEVLGDDFHG